MRVLTDALAWLALLGLFAIALAAYTGADATAYIDARAFLLVVFYGFFVAIGRYRPGVFLYRMVVLGEPERHLPPELERARDFAAFAGRRLLFAGLIFTLADIAALMLRAPGMYWVTPALPTCLLAALYAMMLFMLTFRAARFAVARAY